MTETFPCRFVQHVYTTNFFFNALVGVQHTGGPFHVNRRVSTVDSKVSVVSPSHKSPLAAQGPGADDDAAAPPVTIAATDEKSQFEIAHQKQKRSDAEEAREAFKRVSTKEKKIRYCCS